jgi:hypothetical protein
MLMYRVYDLEIRKMNINMTTSGDRAYIVTASIIGAGVWRMQDKTQHDASDSHCVH